jgi:uncharacterized ferredoxin-like protein
VTVIVTDNDKMWLQKKMLEIGWRDVDNLEHAPVVVLIGTRKAPLQLPACGHLTCRESG